MIDKKALCEFLVRAKKATYASGDEKKEVKEDDGFSGEEKILRLDGFSGEEKTPIFTWPSMLAV
jgi:hypothetical protein